MFLQRHLLPRLILVLPGSGKEAGGGGLAQMGLGVEAAPPGPTGAVGQDLDGQEHGCCGIGGCQLAGAVPRPGGMAE